MCRRPGYPCFYLNDLVRPTKQMTILWTKCIAFNDKWAGVPVSFTACCSIKDENGKYLLGVTFSKYFEKDYELTQRCYTDDSFGIKIVTVKIISCIESLMITDHSVSGNVVVDVKLCAPIFGCTKSKRVGVYPFDIRFFKQGILDDYGFTSGIRTAEGTEAFDATEYEPIITPLSEE
jgi:hypothetical protein